MAYFRFLLALWVSASAALIAASTDASAAERPAAGIRTGSDIDIDWGADVATPTSYYENIADNSAMGECGYGCGAGYGCEAACGCENGCGCSLWTVRAGMISLWRNHVGAEPSIQGYQRTAKVYDATETELGTAIGPEVSLARCLNCNWDLEARFFQINGWTNTANIGGATEFSGYGDSFFTASPTYHCASQLYNVETNLRWKRWESVPLLIGFRMLGLDDQFRLTSEIQGTQVSLINASTNNVLYGFQIGTEPLLYCGEGFRLDGVLKTGIFSNQVNQRTTFQALQSELETRNGIASFVGEVGLTATWQLNECWAVRAGYEVLWITNVALAPDQSATIVDGSPATGVMYDKATAFYHGANASIERRF